MTVERATEVEALAPGTVVFELWILCRQCVPLACLAASCSKQLQHDVCKTAWPVT